MSRCHRFTGWTSLTEPRLIERNTLFRLDADDLRTSHSEETMSERSEYAPGEFCWVDLATSDTDAAAKLYGDLLGWETRSAGPVEETGGYAFFLRDGKQVAGYGP